MARSEIKSLLMVINAFIELFEDVVVELDIPSEPSALDTSKDPFKKTIISKILTTTRMNRHIPIIMAKKFKNVDLRCRFGNIVFSFYVYFLFYHTDWCGVNIFTPFGVR